MANTKNKSAKKKGSNAVKKGVAVKKAAPMATKSSVKSGKTAKSAPKTEKKSAKKKLETVPVALTTEERRKLLKPKDQFVEVVERATRALGRRREIRVPGMTVAKLKGLTAKAVRAATKESIAREQFERKIRPLSDARLLAEDAAYRALLSVYAAVKLYARADPGVGEEFAFLIEHLTFAREKAEPAPAPERDARPDSEPT